MFRKGKITRRAFRDYVGMVGLVVRGRELVRVGNYPEEIFSTEETVVGKIERIIPPTTESFRFYVKEQYETDFGDLVLVGHVKDESAIFAIGLERNSALEEV